MNVSALIDGMAISWLLPHFNALYTDKLQATKRSINRSSWYLFRNNTCGQTGGATMILPMVLYFVPFGLFYYSMHMLCVYPLADESCF